MTADRPGPARVPGSAAGAPAFAASGADRLARLRWWQISELTAIEADLFGAEQWSAAMFWNELASGHYYLAAVDGSGAVTGYAGLAVSGDEGWVNNIAVRRDRQRRGLGRRLLEALLDEARRRGVRQVLLEVAADNAPAQRMYALRGFEAIGVRRGYYQPSNTDALVMSLPMGAAGSGRTGGVQADDGRPGDGRAGGGEQVSNEQPGGEKEGTEHVR